MTNYYFLLLHVNCLSFRFICLKVSMMFSLKQNIKSWLVEAYSIGGNLSTILFITGNKSPPAIMLPEEYTVLPKAITYDQSPSSEQ